MTTKVYAKAQEYENKIPAEGRGCYHCNFYYTVIDVEQAFEAGATYIIIMEARKKAMVIEHTNHSLDTVVRVEDLEALVKEDK